MGLAVGPAATTNNSPQDQFIRHTGNEWLWSVPLAFARIEKLMQHYKAQLWVHHDFEDYKGRKLAPQYYE